MPLFKYRFSSIYFLLFFVFTLHSCNSLKQDNSGNSNHKTEIEAVRNNQIISVIFNVYKPSGETKDSISIFETIISDGFLKEDLQGAPTNVPGKWRFSLLDNDYQIIKNSIIDDPLIVDHEFISLENGKEMLKHKIMKLKEASISVRARYDLSMKYIQMEKTDSMGNPYVHKIFDLEGL